MKLFSGLVACIGMAGFTIANAQAEVEISGVVEAELGSSEDFAGVKSSDIVLATVELGIDAKVNDRVGIHVLTLHEDDDTEPMEVDEGFISVAYSGDSYISAGRMYVPFGVFESNMISDPLTLELGETREAALLIGFQGAVYGSIYLFNGDTIEAGTVEDKIEHYGFNLGITRNFGSESYDAGVGFISSLGDSDVVSELIDGNTGGVVAEYVSGISLHYNYMSGSFNFFIEYTAASDPFDAAAFGGATAEPSATNIEIGQSTGNATWALALQNTEEALALGLPEKRVMLSYSNEIGDATALSFEFAKDTDYDVAVGGTGVSANIVTIQLAAEF